MKNRKQFRSILSFLMILVVFITPLQTTAEGTYTCPNYYECNSGGVCYEVIEECVLRDQPYREGKTIGTLPSGTLIRVKEIITNSKGNKWARIEYKKNDETVANAYVYSEHIIKHIVHDYIPVLETATGAMSVCATCGYCDYVFPGNSGGNCDATCVLRQGILGDYSGEETTFWGIVARIAVGEIPYISTAADVRDLFYDATHSAGALAISLDAAALLPTIGIIKYLGKINGVKYSNEVLEVSKHIDDIPWGRWNDYEKVTKNGREYAKIGSFLYSEHAVNEFIPSFIQSKTFRTTFEGLATADTSRGIPPKYIEWIMTDGIKDGSTLIDPVKTSGGYTRYINGSVDILVDRNNIIVTAITTKRTSAEYAELASSIRK